MKNLFNYISKLLLIFLCISAPDFLFANTNHKTFSLRSNTNSHRISTNFSGYDFSLSKFKKNDGLISYFGLENKKFGNQQIFINPTSFIDARYAAIKDFNTSLAWGYDDKNLTKGDIDYYVLNPVLHLNKNIHIPMYYVMMLSNGSDFNNDNSARMFEKFYTQNIGLDINFNYNIFSLWSSTVFQWGKAKLSDNSISLLNSSEQHFSKNANIKSWAGSVGGGFDFGKAGLHGNFLYATGNEDKNINDGNINAFISNSNRNKQWAKIMGKALNSRNEYGDSFSAQPLTDLVAYNVGGSCSLMENLNLALDLWYGKLEGDGFRVDGKHKQKLGTEIDVLVSYILFDSLQIDISGAYLFAGDVAKAKFDGATQSYTSPIDHSNPFEVSTHLSLSF